MTSVYTSARVPASYELSLRTYRCCGCDGRFDMRASVGGKLIRLVSSTTGEERWLPTDEPGGYLDLLERLVPGYSRAHPLTPEVAERFRTEFAAIQERPADGGYFFIDQRRLTCPTCRCRKIELCGERALEGSRLAWVRYLSG